MRLTEAIPTPGFLHPFWDVDVHTRLANFAAIRERSNGVEFHEQPDGAGFWSVTSYSAVRSISRDSATFVNAQGFSLDDFPQELLETMASIIAMDGTRHQQQRKLVQRVFSARAITKMTDYVGALADQIVTELRQRREFDFIETVAGYLPLQVIADLLDIPASDRPHMRELINTILGADDEEFGGREASARGLAELYGYALELGTRRLKQPGDDITSLLMHAEIDGKRLTPAEFGSFVILLVAAGNDTTRTGLAWAMMLLSAHPDQRRALAERYVDLHDGAIDEILRWCSPVQHMRRTVLRDTEIDGQPLSEGDKVVLWYMAANHDPAVFADPDAFDITRSNAREHIAFGAGGPHFCLGSHLAKMEIRVVLDRLLTAFPDIHTTGEPSLLVSPFVNGVKALPCYTGL